MPNNEIIKIKYHTNIDLIEINEKGDWIDLRAAEDVFIPLNEFTMINLGISMKLPEGYEAHIVPRSSTFKKWGIIQCNHQAVIDESYCGENDIWRYPVYCLSNRSGSSVQGTMIHKNDRICQFRIVKKQPTVTFEIVDHMEDADRGGFGSTGVN